MVQRLWRKPSGAGWWHDFDAIQGYNPAAEHGFLDNDFRRRPQPLCRLLRQEHGHSGLQRSRYVFELPSDLYYQYDGYAGNGQSALLQAVRSSMRKTFSSSDIGADGQVVFVSFQDGISFEVVPVFTNKAGSYTFPDANGGGSWKTTNPRPEIEAIRARSAACNGNLVRLCRMMRAWNWWNEE